MARRSLTRLPDELRPLFWDCDFRKLSIERYRSYIVRRLVELGGPKIIEWLRTTVGDDAIREDLAKSRGRGLPYGRIRRWVSRRDHARWAAEWPHSIWAER